ncbi:MAG: hypothetical protein COB36_09190 [Alphaproteobacteria bacterium]|nr:MAG: hypothetical protein COB36_09190 [Alphaproteobacteria bacterium]
MDNRYLSQHLQTKNVETHIQTPPMRSLLFVPTNNPAFIKKAAMSAADAIILDLEDSILPEAKAEARQQVITAANMLKENGHYVIVRINRPLHLAVLDISCAVRNNVDAIMISKAQSKEHLTLLTEELSLAEAKNKMGKVTKLIPLIETPTGVMNIDEIASHERVIALACGDEDLSAELECDPQSRIIEALKEPLIISASRYHRIPLGLIGTISEYKNLELFKSYADNAHALGLQGTLCIHPDQIAVANRSFTPNKKQIIHAEQIIDTFVRSNKEGKGVISYNGRMIDAPIIERARNLLKRAAKFNKENF